MSSPARPSTRRQDLLRFLTAGSVDDGKSTLIGRLLHDSKTIYDDHLASLRRDSKRVGSAGGSLDFALLTDGLRAEREQGITIDVAYRYFSTPRRKFIIADCPGHEQYTRNMATGASTADLAVILVDATRGVLAQTRRHSFIASLLGIGHIVVAINKMDLVGFSQEVFEKLRSDYEGFAARLEVSDIHFVPISALDGDNVVDPGERMGWYRGGPLLHHLETVHVGSARNFIDLRFPIQLVLREDARFRGYCGTVASGLLRAGAEVTVLPSGRRTRIRSIHTYEGEIREAFPPMAVTVTLADDIDASRGDMLVQPNNVPLVTAEIDAIVVWMGDAPMSLERSYFVQQTTAERKAEITQVVYKFDIHDLHREPATTLAMNEIGRVKVSFSRPLAVDPYARNRVTGSFILIDPATNVTVGAGMVLDRKSVPADAAGVAAAAATELRQHQSLVTREERAARLPHGPATIWFTGLPCSGKSTTAYALERRLFDAGCLVHVLDGENLRQGISDDLGFGALERSENVRRAAHVARLCNDAGMVTIVALVSPSAADRREAREIVGAGRFVEVAMTTPVEVCEARDAQGLYRRARSGEIGRFTGVSAPYDAPTKADLEIDASVVSVDWAVDQLEELLRRRAILPASGG